MSSMPASTPRCTCRCSGSTASPPTSGCSTSARPQPGETVVVSAASGSVGHLVGQMARIHGCRVVGITGSDAKGEVLTGQLGFDAAVNHRSDTFRDDFKAATPDGIGIYFDNTGGDILGSCLRRMAPHGRIVCCGVVSQYDTTDPAPGPRGIPGLLVNNRVRMEGFLVFDFADRYDDGPGADARLARRRRPRVARTTRSPVSNRHRTRSSTCWPAATSAPASCGSPTRPLEPGVSWSSSSGRTSRARRRGRSSGRDRRRGRRHPW